MRESALRSAESAERFGQPHDGIVLSAKVSDVRDLVTTKAPPAPITRANPRPVAAEKGEVPAPAAPSAPRRESLVQQDSRTAVRARRRPAEFRPLGRRLGCR